MSSVWLHLSPSLTLCLAAVEDYQEAKEFDDKQEIREGLDRAQKLLKLSLKRDYYKILGVPRYTLPSPFSHVFRH